VVLLNFMRNNVRYFVNKQIRERMQAQTLFKSKVESPVAFCIVHWNAPDFLLLTVRQIELLHPNSKIYVLDNGSKQIHLAHIQAQLKKFKNITLLSLRGCPKWAKNLHLDKFFEWQTYATGLQFLLNYSAKQSDEIAVFLDQDCILSTQVDELFSKFSQDIILIGARDSWRGHTYSKFVHNSFMIMQPKSIRRAFGKSSFYDSRTDSFGSNLGDHAGLSFKALGKILYLEPRTNDKIPLLTSYSYNEKIYAWHAWYSSRTIGLTNQESIDGYPVVWLDIVRKNEYEFMMQLHEKTAANLKIH
jgi:hypothetical protein